MQILCGADPWGTGEIEVAEGVRAQIERLRAEHPEITFTEAFNFVDPVQEGYEGSMYLLYEGAVLAIIIACSMFPGITLLIPLFKLFTGSYPWFPLNWMNTYQALIIPSLSFGLPLCVWNLTAFFRQLPVELEQAAMVDGCTPGQAFVRVILPLAAPGIFTTAIITFIAVWNDYMIALQFGTTPDMYTSIVALSKFTGQYGFDTPWGTIMAAGVMITVPLLIAVLIFQRRIVAGLTAGGVK